MKVIASETSGGTGIPGRGGFVLALWKLRAEKYGGIHTDRPCYVHIFIFPSCARDTFSVT